MSAPESPARAAVVSLLKAEREWRRVFRVSCETGALRLWTVAYQLRDELQTRGEWFSREEIAGVLFTLAREKLSESPGAHWDARWTSGLCREALVRLSEAYSTLSEYERARLDLSGQDEWHEKMNRAGEEDSPAAFLEALAGWERAGHEAFSRASTKAAS